ncbi:HD-GYP domain-containing protein [Petrachloros mirabilis]
MDKEESRITDIYVRAERQLTEAAKAIQRRERIHLDGISNLAAEITESVGRGDELVVQALSGPGGSILVTNLINVGVLAAKVGAALGFYGNELHRLTLGGLVHDIGLFAIPEAIMTKSARFTDEERKMVERHPQLGHEVVQQCGSEYGWLAEIVKQAHERWNGRGYPNRLNGRSINEEALIIGAVDVFDALVTPRPYRRRFTTHEALRELIIGERMSFPREIIKALVEQLSAYPLGTLVRLSSGELGTVIGVNVRFPLRPIVEVRGETALGGGAKGRCLDLSRLPLVWVIETIESPSIARVAFSSGGVSDSRTGTVPSVSLQFSSLLESLDALANAIQGVVEGRIPASRKSGTGTEEERASALSRAPLQNHADESFEKEVIGLFALEAYEWLAQIYSALKRLGEGVNDAARPKLYGIMLQGLTNLAKSAATVHLSAIEDMATSLLPILPDVGRQDPHLMSKGMALLRDGLDRISDAVRQAEGKSSAEEGIKTREDSEVVEQVVATRPESAPISSEVTALVQEVGAGGTSLLQALRYLQQVRSRSEQPARDVLEAVIIRAEQQPGALTAEVLREILKDLDCVDEHFLDEVRNRVPMMSDILADLRKDEAVDFITASQLDPVLQQVEALHELAVTVQAGKIIVFLEGLRSFLMVTAYRKAATLPQRLANVQARIQALGPMAEQWVNIGRVERAAIAEILPVA